MRYLIPLFLVACAAPAMQVPIEQIPSLPTLEDVMRVQATYADPQFKKIGSTFTDADWAELSELGTRLQATSTKTKAFTRGPGFDKLADQMNAQAAALGAAATAKDSAGANKSLEDLKTTCRSCHKEYR